MTAAVFCLLLVSNAAALYLWSRSARALRTARLRTAVVVKAAELDRRARAAESLLWTVR